MSEQVVLPNGEEADVVLANSIFLRSIGADPNVDAKGGESPAMFFDKFSKIQPVYIVGILPSLTIPTSSSSASSVVARTSIKDTALAVPNAAITYGSTVTVPDGASGITLYMKNAIAGAWAAGCAMAIDISDDGITWLSTGAGVGTVIPPAYKNIGALAQGDMSFTTYGFTATTVFDGQTPMRHALPKYVRAMFMNTSGAALTADSLLVVA